MRSQTTTSCRIQVVSLMLAGLISMTAHAEVIPGRWEKGLRLGNGIIHHSRPEKRESNPGSVSRPVVVRSGTLELRWSGSNSESRHPEHYTSFQGWVG